MPPKSLESSHLFSITVPIIKRQQHNYALSHHKHLIPPVKPGIAEDNETCKFSGMSLSAEHCLEEDNARPPRAKVRSLKIYSCCMFSKY